MMREKKRRKGLLKLKRDGLDIHGNVSSEVIQGRRAGKRLSERRRKGHVK